MLTNSDCTIYHRIHNLASGQSTWERQYVPECWWFCNTKSSITTNGLKSADVLTVRIPDLTVSVKKGDILVKGACPAEIETVKDLSGYEYFKTVSANHNRFGGEPHIKVEGA